MTPRDSARALVAHLDQLLLEHRQGLQPTGQQMETLATLNEEFQRGLDWIDQDGLAPWSAVVDEYSSLTAQLLSLVGASLRRARQREGRARGYAYQPERPGEAVQS